MKVLIDISEEDYLEIKDPYRLTAYWANIRAKEAIRNGTPIPEDATNGDVITSIINPDDENCVLICAHDGTVLLEVTEDWWNAPYKGGE